MSMHLLFPVFMAADMIVFGMIGAGMGFYFERPSSLFFGACDFAIAWMIMDAEKI